MTKLIVTRAAEWNNKAREFGIYLNEKKKGQLQMEKQKNLKLNLGAIK